MTDRLWKIFHGQIFPGNRCHVLDFRSGWAQTDLLDSGNMSGLGTIVPSFEAATIFLVEKRRFIVHATFAIFSLGRSQVVG